MLETSKMISLPLINVSAIAEKLSNWLPCASSSAER